ncbi:septum site-determining protein MinC [Ciceribacter sp. L1K22]|uniref:septum site-determining protein MinC n=1 Tax=Ciceribacter sp. L1K22 TaxID=2820275 RepID=UPI001ABDE24A|nr:septum site-determining protein MinC [Ciceribacter sp. L1K22]MBO3759538.1 septum site-determining protein MinC [Ciceribacter sp. L1K22]
MSKVLTEARAIRIKGRSFLAVVLTPELPVADWLARLEDLAARSAGFFLSRPVVLDIAELDISRAELRELIDELAARNVRIMGIEGGRPSLFDATMPPQLKGGLEGAEIEVPEDNAGERKPAAVQRAAEKSGPAFAVHGSSSLVLREPVRSGQTVIFPEGDVTVLGSVASGAEVIAGGSIHVYGTLRGRALAGTSGNPSAAIFCRKLEAELLAVDGIYKTAEDLPPEMLGKPAHLWLDGESIVAETIA